MSDATFATTIGMVAGLGALCAAALAWIARRFGIPEDPRIRAVEAALPGINCGGCGFAGCLDYARAVVERDAPATLCAPGGAGVAARLCELTGRAAEDFQPRTAVVHCGGGLQQARRIFAYNGIEDCAAAQAVDGGDKACAYGCLGYGSCRRVCPTDAIVIEDGLARVLPERCIACGACVKTCPRALIDLAPRAHTLHVLCRSKDKGPAVKSYCRVGCIGCRICTKLDENGAFQMDGFLAVVDYRSPPATNPTLVQKCPGHCIRSL